MAVWSPILLNWGFDSFPSRCVAIGGAILLRRAHGRCPRTRHGVLLHFAETLYRHIGRSRGCCRVALLSWSRSSEEARERGLGGCRFVRGGGHGFRSRWCGVVAVGLRGVGRYGAGRLRSYRRPSLSGVGCRRTVVSGRASWRRAGICVQGPLRSRVSRRR